MTQATTRPMTPDEFRRAEEALYTDLTPVLARHRQALDGEMGVTMALVELVGSLCKATVDLAPQAKPPIIAQLQQLLLYVETTGTRP